MKNFGTKLIHGENSIDKITGSLATPIYTSSTFHQFDINNFGKYDYSRSGNPTREALEDTIARLECGKYGYAFASGMAAISTVLSIFSQGDHLVICGDVYGGTYRAVTQLFSRFGIRHTFVDASDLKNIEKAIIKDTKGIYLETPSNPLLKITDLNGVAKLVKGRDIITIVDNTFLSPYLQQPLKLGIDIVVHSATKFLGGHSDVVAGLVVTNKRSLGERIYKVQNTFGAILGPQECYLLLRGIKTLKVRLEAAQNNAGKLALWLKSREEVLEVYYPGLKDHCGKEIHDRQAYGPGAVLSFELKTTKQALEFLSKVQNVAVAVSLGAVETIVSYPAKMSHASIPKAEREKLGVTDSLIRVSLGIEDINDIIDGFKYGLE